MMLLGMGVAAYADDVTTYEPGDPFTDVESLLTNQFAMVQGEKALYVADAQNLAFEVLVAHNAHFDLLFLAYAQIRAKKEHGLLEEYEKFKDADYLDTLTIYRDRRRFPHKLENAIQEYGLSGKVENSHRAVDDCRALYEVTKRMWEEKADLDKYVNVFGFLKKYSDLWTAGL